MPRILYVVNDFSFFISHRLPIAQACLDKGWEVHVATSKKDKAKKSALKLGIKWHGLRLENGSYSLFKDIIFFKDLLKLYKSVLPNIVHNVTIKPVLYGSIASRIAKVPALIDALSGLGYLYINNSLKNKIVRWGVNIFFKIGFKHPNHILILQNEDDMKLVLKHNLLPKEKIHIIRGSGVDENYYSFSPEKKGNVKVGLPARMLWDKGIGEFVEAAKILKKQHLAASFHLFGEPDPKNPQSISLKTLKKWNAEGIVVYEGFQSEMKKVLKNMQIICLPSYREGLPKALLEAASMGRPIVTTDAPGCREVVKDNVNGYLVPVGNVSKLAEKLKKLILEPKTRKKFGKNGRKRVLKNFRIKKIIGITIKTYEKLL